MDLQKVNHRKRLSRAAEACFPKLTLNLWLSSLQRLVQSLHLRCFLLQEDVLQVESMSLCLQGEFATSERMDS